MGSERPGPSPSRRWSPAAVDVSVQVGRDGPRQRRRGRRSSCSAGAVIESDSPTPGFRSHQTAAEPSGWSDTQGILRPTNSIRAVEGLIDDLVLSDRLALRTEQIYNRLLLLLAGALLAVLGYGLFSR
jgi:hypothetical protein